MHEAAKVTDLLSWRHAFLLGALQGLTEFLPISSKGHLALAESLLHTAGGSLAFIVLLHVGTLLSILAVYPRGVLRLVRGTLRLPGSLGTPIADWHPEAVLAAKVTASAAPAGAFGLLLYKRIEGLFTSVELIGGLLLVTAALLLSTRWAKRGEADVSWRIAWIIGCAQAFALLPGISRSGTTIAAAILCGVARPRAAEFSFLSSVPLILGSFLLELPALHVSASAGAVPSFFVGFVTSFLVGCLALVFVVRLIHGGRLHWFSLYCAAAGFAGLLGPTLL